MWDVAKHFGIDKEKICAFGDSGNDIKMLEMAALGIALGNGTAECRLAADYVTEDIVDEGVYKALLHFGFIEE